jgi:NTE family protein
MKRALVLAGGGARGAFEVGAAYQLIKERELWFDVVTGVSIGAINGSLLGQATSQEQSVALIEELKEAWYALKGNDDVYRQWYPWAPEWLNAGLTLVNNKKSLYHLKPARKLIEAHVDPARLRDSGIEVRFGYVDFVSGRYVAASNREHPDLIGAITASGSIPVTFPPVPLPGDEEGLDGGVRNATPLASAFEALRLWPESDVPDEMYTVIPSTRPRTEPVPELAGIEMKSWLKVGERAVNLMADEIHVNDVKHALEINELVKTHCSPDPRYRYVDIKLIFPERSLGPGLTFDPKAIRENFEHGLERAREIT